MSTFKNLSYVPMFPSKVVFTNDSIQREAEDKCQGYPPCIFDAAALNDASFGALTLEVNQEQEKEQVQLGMWHFFNVFVCGCFF